MLCSVLCSQRLCTQITLCTGTESQSFPAWAEGRLCHVPILHNACTCDLEAAFTGVRWQNSLKDLGGLEMTLGSACCCKLQIQWNFSVPCKGPMSFLYLHHPELSAKAGAMLCFSALAQMKKVLSHPISSVCWLAAPPLQLGYRKHQQQPWN